MLGATCAPFDPPLVLQPVVFCMRDELDFRVIVSHFYELNSCKNCIFTHFVLWLRVDDLGAQVI